MQTELRFFGTMIIIGLETPNFTPTDYSRGANGNDKIAKHVRIMTKQVHT